MAIEKSEFKNFSDEKVSKVILDIPSNVPKLRKLLEEEYNIECYEADIRFYMRFLIDHDIKGTLEISGKFKKGNYVDRIYEEPMLKSSDWAPELKVLSIDIETDGKTKEIYCISLFTEGLSEGKAHSEHYKKVIIVANEKDIGKELKYAVSVNSEAELVKKFQETVQKIDPDIITGWNLIDFDLKVLKEHFDKHKIPFKLGRIDWPCKIELNDSFMRDSSADFPGRMVLDGIQLLRTSFVKLDNYKLETAAEKILGEKKLVVMEDRRYEIERMYKEDQQKLVNYNLKDSELVYKILIETKALALTLQRSLITGMTLERVRASVASLDSLFLRYARKLKIVLNNSKFSEKEEGFKGGYVMNSVPGIYDYVLVLDFKSLYQSIIRTLNIDTYSYVEKKDLPKHLAKDKFVTAANGAVFKNQSGILPMIIQDVWKQRDDAKKQKQPAHIIYALKIIMNSFYGVLGNPSCRFFNKELSNAITYTAEEIIKLTAKKVEGVGYEIIYGDSVAKDSEVITEDADGIKFNKICDLYTKTSNVSAENKEYCILKNTKILTLDTKGHSVFKNAKYIMRHKTRKKMFRVYFTNYWFIDVTEDHSLIGYINKSKNNNLSVMNRLLEIKPTDIGKRIKSIVSIKRIPNKNVITKNYPKEVYEFMGYFIGDGSFRRNKSHQMYNKDYYLGLSLGKDGKEVFNKLIKPLMQKKFIKNYWWSKSRKGDLIINGLKIIDIISKEFRDANGKKIIPDWLILEKEENICAFLRGLFSADGCVMIRNDAPIIKVTSIEDEHIDKIRKLLHLTGISHSVFKENNVNRFKVKNSTKVYSNGSYSKNIIIKNKTDFVKNVGFLLDRKNKSASIKTDSLKIKTIKHCEFDLSAVLKIEEIKYDDYVYDIEVEDTHRFFANNVLVHNTDSIFVVSGAKDVSDAEKIGHKLEKYINDFYKDYVKEKYSRISFFEIQFEKLFKIFLMPKIRGSVKEDEGGEVGAKKRYAGLLIKDGKEEMSFTGMEFVRGDWTDLAKKFQLKLFEMIFNKKEVDKYIREFVSDLKEGKYDDLLVYKKNIKKPLSEYTKTTPPHVKAARMLKRLTSNQIQYVMTTHGPEPIELLKHKPDYEHYVDKQIKPIADTILSVYGKSFDDILKSSTQSKLFGY